LAEVSKRPSIRTGTWTADGMVWPSLTLRAGVADRCGEGNITHTENPVICGAATMARIVRGGLIQATLCEPATSPVQKIKQAMIEKHEAAIAKAVDRGAQVICLQELFYGPYFCAEQQTKWYDLTERVPEGPTCKRFCEIAKKHGIVLILPVYEEEQAGVY